MKKLLLSLALIASPMFAVTEEVTVEVKSSRIPSFISEMPSVIAAPFKSAGSSVVRAFNFTKENPKLVAKRAGQVLAIIATVVLLNKLANAGFNRINQKADYTNCRLANVRTAVRGFLSQANPLLDSRDRVSQFGGYVAGKLRLPGFKTAVANFTHKVAQSLALARVVPVPVAPAAATA